MSKHLKKLRGGRARPSVQAGLTKPYQRRCRKCRVMKELREFAVHMTTVSDDNGELDLVVRYRTCRSCKKEAA